MKHISILIFIISFSAYSQEWLPWSSWEKAMGEELIYRKRVKYTTRDTYAVQLEWKNDSNSDLKIKFEVRDKKNNKQIKVLKIPAGSTKAMFAGTSFKNMEIRIRLLNIGFLTKPDN
ncbi:hypothetical protein [Christiangramia echinicola]|uniref:hypothetical protein n=1 Tax=Christiangramia echinicola TaxID=279359 RepID=UPI0004010CD7|nr:hypothetical protein [Christiangramia echinicola]